MDKIQHQMGRYRQNIAQAGQGLAEYALILVLASIVVIGILSALGPQVGSIFSEITDALSALTSNGDSGGASWQLLRNEMEGCVPPGTLRNHLNEHINERSVSDFSADVNSAMGTSEISSACGYTLLGIAGQL